MTEGTKILGVVNLTPDSFSDGGRLTTVKGAVDFALRLLDQGADIIDIGGESTRPGAERVTLAEEQARVLPVLEELVRRGIVVSVDTMNAGTAREAADAGAAMINDVSGGLADSAMAGVIAETGLPYIVMHWRGHSAEMESLANYRDVPTDVRRELKSRVAELVVAGVRAEQIILDPGLGFSKDGQHNWQVLAHLSKLQSLGYPILIGASRKRFLSQLPHGIPPGSDLRARRGAGDAVADPRDFPTAIVSALASAAGVWAVRVHDPRSTRIALDVVEAWKGGLSR